VSSPTIHFVSLGCPKNRVDTEVMLGVAEGAGYAHVPDARDAEVIVVPGAGHSDLAPFTPYIGDIVAFLGRNLSPDVPAVTS